MKGKLYGIGVGPGDPELLTLKAKRILDEADIIAVPVKEAGEESTALEIIRPVVDLEHKSLLEVIFRMAKDKEERKKCRAAACGQLTAELSKGKNLKSAAVRKNCSVPIHKFVQAARLFDNFMSGSEIKVVGV